MKKLLGTCLSIALILALLCPQLTVMAQPDNDPAVQEVTNYSDETFWEWMGYETVEELMQWVLDRYWYSKTTCEPFWQVWLWSGSSKEYFMELFDMDENEYQILEEAWQKAWKEYMEEQHLRQMRELEELGGTPGIMNVMFNGGFIKFAGAVPEITGGSAFVPAKAFFEALGAEVSYNTQTREIIAEFEGWSVGFMTGRDTMSVTEDGAMRERPIDAAPYTKKGVAYIPIRAVAEALGYSVYWDPLFGAVVIIDMKKAAEEIDKDFTIINSLFEIPMGMPPVDETTYKTVLDMLISIKLFDSLDGDSTAGATAKITTISDGRNQSITGRIDLSALIGMLLTGLSEYMYDEEESAELVRQLDMFKEITADLIFNYDEGMLYIKSPILSELFPEFQKDAWLSVSGLDEYYSNAADLWSILEELGFEGFGDKISVGRIIAYETTNNAYRNQIYIYRDIVNSAEVAKALIGDEKFTEKNGDYTITLTREDLSKILVESGEYLPYLINEFDLKFTIKTDDGEITGVSGDFIIRTGPSVFGVAVRIACKFDICKESTLFSLEVHVKNLVVVLIEIDSETAKTNESVPAAPPDKAVIIPIEELLGIDDEYGPDYIEHLRLIA